jgi:molybdopterin-guanine dinucleotide biosynthesis protein A
LLKRESLPVLKQQISENKLSLRECFKQLNAQSTLFQKQSLFCHSINSLDELQQYQQMKAFRQMFI